MERLGIKENAARRITEISLRLFDQVNASLACATTTRGE